LEVRANGLYLPATSLIVGSPVDHTGEMLQVTGDSWLNGDVAISGSLSFGSKPNISLLDRCVSSFDKDKWTFYTSSVGLYVCKEQVLYRVPLVPVAKMSAN
ncbi:MAG TPA: hypothetical protein VNF04_13785, partial [Stellaceae bacterium]|nr:hypothetical protein [Stellaceae bacterium]